MKNLQPTLFFLLITLSCFAQNNSDWKLLYSIEKEIDFIAFDNLFNVYSIHESEIAKYNSQGQFQIRYSDKRLGQIGQVDVEYPLKPLLNYPDLNNIAILDNTLSNNRGNIDLSRLNIAIGALAINSVQNHYWFYDAMTFSLIRANDNLQRTSTTGNLSQVLGVELDPVYMVEFANRLYLNNPKTGILVFDIFGTYIKTIPLKGLNRFQVFENEIVYFHDNKITRYNTQLYKETIIPIPFDCKDALIQKNRIAIQTDKGFAVLENTGS